jgi:hypothetical protein
VHDLLQELRLHVIVFFEEIITLMEGALESWQLMTKEKYTTSKVAAVNLPTNI